MNMPTLSGQDSAVKDERTPLLSERIRLALVKAGSVGRTSRSLAVEFYGEPGYLPQSRVTQLVRTLRGRGVRIVSVKDAGFTGIRYVLAEFQPETHD